VTTAAPQLNDELDIDARSPLVEEFEHGLMKKVIGQERAIRQIGRAWQTFLAGLRPPGRPIANLLFLGPSGSGKTLTVEAVASFLFGSSTAFLKVDCAEFSHGHEVSKLIGAAPGYLGHRETPAMLSQKALDKYQEEGKPRVSILLFDEIEKAHPDFHDMLLGILDKGILHISTGEDTDFTRTFVFMTSNIGSHDVNKLTTGAIGFEKGATTDAGELDQKIYKVAKAAAEKKFRPEFMNRIDKVVVFRALTPEHLEKILDIELGKVQARIIDNLPAPRVFLFTALPAARKFLIQEGTDKTSGARNLKRTIEKHVVTPLSNLISTRQTDDCELILVDYPGKKGKRLTFTRERKK
jgi:ATP-dependent Clp protease ATP-binding subunit ClpB